MKTHLKKISAIILSAVAIMACETKETVVDSYITPDRVTITEIDAQSPVPQAIALKTNTQWMVLDVPSWIEVSPITGHGDGILTITPSANFKNETVQTEPRSGQFRIIGSANSAAYNTGVSVIITVAQQGFEPQVDPNAGLGGIPSLEEFLAFADMVTSGGSVSRWVNEAGEVELKTDIDLSGVTAWTPIGQAKLGSGVKADPTMETYFTGTFNGGGHTISGINWTFDAAKYTNCTSFGLFGAASEATIKNLVLGKEGDAITITGSTTANIAVGALVGCGANVKVLGVTNYVDVIWNGDTDPQFAMAGIVARGDHCTVGGADAEAVVNYGDVVAKSVISLGEAGEAGHMVGGIQGFMKQGSINYAKNYGTVSCGSGRGGGIVGSINNTQSAEDFAHVLGCVNYGTVRRDLFGNTTVTGNQKRMGGIFGGAEGWMNKIENCTNEGNVFSEYLCRCGGCCGHAKIQVVGFENKGIILSDKDSSHGPGWISGYFDTVANAQKNGAETNISKCKMGGKVGDWTTYKDAPENAPAATLDNVLGYNNTPGKTFTESEIIQ